jgi:hypothetical protein
VSSFYTSIITYTRRSAHLLAPKRGRVGWVAEGERSMLLKRVAEGDGIKSSARPLAEGAGFPFREDGGVIWGSRQRRRHRFRRKAADWPPEGGGHSATPSIGPRSGRLRARRKATASMEFGPVGFADGSNAVA